MNIRGGGIWGYYYIYILMVSNLTRSGVLDSSALLLSYPTITHSIANNHYTNIPISTLLKSYNLIFTFRPHIP